MLVLLTNYWQKSTMSTLLLHHFFFSLMLRLDSFMAPACATCGSLGTPSVSYWNCLNCYGELFQHLERLFSQRLPCRPKPDVLGYVLLLRCSRPWALALHCSYCLFGSFYSFCSFILFFLFCFCFVLLFFFSVHYCSCPIVSDHDSWFSLLVSRPWLLPGPLWRTNYPALLLDSGSSSVMLLLFSLWILHAHV